MKQAIGLIELTSIAKGIEAADRMLKAAQVGLLEAKPTCPGKYLIMIYGEVAAVANAVEVGLEVGQAYVIDEFILPSVHPAVISAMGSSSEIPAIKSLGIIESFSIAALITAADTAAKAASVDLIEIRNGLGIGGKSYVTMTGDVSSVQAAVDAGAAVVNEKGMLISTTTIAAPHPLLKQSLL